jgi:signal transduction histidine kinase
VGRALSDGQKQDGIAGGQSVPTGAQNAASRRSELSASQPERIQVIGALATGVAHEFNNLLTIALGSLEQLRRQTLDERGRDQLERADWSVRQAGRLARQVLSFVRRDTGQAQRVDLNVVMGEFDKIMNHAASDSTRLILELCKDPLPVHLDPGQLELALLNLVRNATDAMPEGGSIVIRTAVHQGDGFDGQQAVEVSVSDTGDGMSPEILERATTSFFTTKPQGQGTGLGLWMVKRFISGCGGKLAIDTAVGQGTTVRLVFPRAERVASPDISERRDCAAPTRARTGVPGPVPGQ